MGNAGFCPSAVLVLALCSMNQSRQASGVGSRVYKGLGCGSGYHGYNNLQTYIRKFSRKSKCFRVQIGRAPARPPTLIQTEGFIGFRVWGLGVRVEGLESN